MADQPLAAAANAGLAAPAEPPPAARGAPVPAHQLAARGWASKLAILVAVLLAIQTVTGLWIYLAPFSIASQLQTLLHTAAGLLFIIPYAIYQVRHFLVWRAQKPTAEMVLGYLAALFVTTCVVTGAVLTWQACAGPKIAPNWDLVHLVTGLVTGSLVAVHIVLAFLRRRTAVREVPELRAGVRRFVRGGLAGCALTAAVVAAAVALWPSRPAEFPLPEGYSLSAYVEQADEYRGNPFAPSYARTSSGKLVVPEILANSASCGTKGCHEQIYAEWQPSATASRP